MDILDITVADTEELLTRWREVDGNMRLWDSQKSEVAVKERELKDLKTAFESNMQGALIEHQNLDQALWAKGIHPDDRG